MIILTVGVGIDICQLFFEVPSVLNKAPENFYGFGDHFIVICHHLAVFEFRGEAEPVDGPPEF